MTCYEYRAIPAPLHGDKQRGLKTPADRFAHALQGALNALGAEGWEYLRAETLPSEERSGLTGRVTQFHNLLIFRRPLAGIDDAAEAGALALSDVEALMLDPLEEPAPPASAPPPSAPPAAVADAPAAPSPAPPTPAAAPRSYGREQPLAKGESVIDRLDEANRR